jgi:hypothetical protein
MKKKTVKAGLRPLSVAATSSSKKKLEMELVLEAYLLILM